MRFNYLLLALSLFLLFAKKMAAQPSFGVADIYQSGQFRERSVDNVNWMKDGQFYTAQSDNDIVQYKVATGVAVKTLLRGSSLPSGIKFSNYSFSPDEKKLLLVTNYQSIYRRSFTADYYVYDLATQQASPLAGDGPQSYATFSPDGRKVAFVRDNNVYYTELTTGRQTAITSDGKFAELIHGSADWVYEEEFSFAKAFEWSPDGQYIAFISFNERRVKEYNLQLWQGEGQYPFDYRFKYPKAGEDNALVSVSIHQLATGKTIRTDLGLETDLYVPRIRWTSQANTLAILRLNRLQNQLDLLHAEANTGLTSVVLTESSPTYVDESIFDNLVYLKDNSHFLWASERDGHKHLYLYETKGKLVRQITKGNWEVLDFLGLDEPSGQLYYTSTEVSPLEKHFYSLTIDGKSKVQLTRAKGMNTIDLSPDFKYCLISNTSTTAPLNVSLVQLPENKTVKVLEKNEEVQQYFAQYQLPQRTFFTCPAADGTPLNGYLLKPANFDPKRKYPVLMHVYGGPGSQQVCDEWNGGYNDLWHAMLTQSGYIVACVDNRGTGARGEAFKKVTYAKLGKYETQDQIAAANYLAKLDYVDKTRLGIWGWSYGGYMTSLCMTVGAGVFKMGIAVAPVTHWRFYDTIYTERFLKRPQDNAAGYDDNSPLTHAAKLRGHFLLIHGTGDDNVHVQNSYALQEALIAANKQFTSFIYPDRNHGIYGGNTRTHLFTMMTDFVLKNL